jgi:hypothetical protein
MLFKQLSNSFNNGILDWFDFFNSMPYLHQPLDYVMPLYLSLLKPHLNVEQQVLDVQLKKRKVEGHDVVERLVKIRHTIEKIKPIENAIIERIRKLFKKHDIDKY